MQIKWMGALLVFLTCGGFGFSVCAAQKREEWALRQLVSALDYMQCELQYRMTPLPELCRQAGLQSKGSIRHVFLQLAEELAIHFSANVSACMQKALNAAGSIPLTTRNNLQQLGDSLGRFDLNGQMKGLEAIRERCREDIRSLTENKENRLRSYQTLGLCAGAALVILFI